MKHQDLERLSAYLDNQLPASERAALEARLAREAELRTALHELRLTVRALRSLPRARPPRSFTLKPEQVGRRAAGGARFPTLRLAAALSAVALVLVIAGDLATSLGAAREAAAPVSVTAFETAEATALAQRAAEAELTATAPAAAAGAAAEAATPAPGTADEMTPFAAMVPAPTETAAPAMLGAPPTAAPSEKVAEPTATAEAPVVPPAATIAAAAPPVPTEPMVTETTVSVYDAGTRAGPQRAPLITPLRMIEAALAMLTVLLGLGAWLARR